MVCEQRIHTQLHVYFRTRNAGRLENAGSQPASGQEELTEAEELQNK